MTAELFAVPFLGGCLCPLPAPRPRRFEKGDRVAWVDGDEGEVTGLIPGQSVAIRWDSIWDHIEWYPLCCGSIDCITVLETEAA
jgi:hypothetical protein